MRKILAEPMAVFEQFEAICNIPHGSGDMQKISDFCVQFAEENGFRYMRDEACNVVIYKAGTFHLKNSAPIILQGHLDMVCQKTEETQTDFEKEGPIPLVEGDFVKACGTTLGADNGIAVAMILDILKRKDLAHPPIEAVFTTDEEIGMLGASALDMGVLSAKRMINLDAEEDDTVTVSCAGGCDVRLSLPFTRRRETGVHVQIGIQNLLGGHSGVEIDKGRVNANILLGRLINHAMQKGVSIVKVCGGTKGNAIPQGAAVHLLVQDWEDFSSFMQDYFKTVEAELGDREKDLCITLKKGEEGTFEVMEKPCAEKLAYMLLATPNGVLDMSPTIEGLVETSLNLGILETRESDVFFQYALRSNKQSALDFLKEKLRIFAAFAGASYESAGEYSPWEYKPDSALQALYAKRYREKVGADVKISAIHAGLECAVFSAKIPGLDCIAIGPGMTGVHTVEEKLSISSTQKIYGLLCDVLQECQ